MMFLGSHFDMPQQISLGTVIQEKMTFNYLLLLPVVPEVQRYTLKGCVCIKHEKRIQLESSVCLLLIHALGDTEVYYILRGGGRLFDRESCWSGFESWLAHRGMVVSFPNL